MCCVRIGATHTIATGRITAWQPEPQDQRLHAPVGLHKPFETLEGLGPPSLLSALLVACQLKVAGLEQPLALLPVLAGRGAHPAMEGGGEMALVLKGQGVAHLRDPAPGAGQQLLGALDPLPQQILVRAQPRALLEQPAEVVGAHLRNAGERRERQLLVQVGLHVLQHALQPGPWQATAIAPQLGRTDSIVLQQVNR